MTTRLRLWWPAELAPRLGEDFITGRYIIGIAVVLRKPFVDDGAMGRAK